MLHAHLVPQKVPQVYFYFLAMPLQRTKIGILSEIDFRISKRRLDPRCEILDPHEFVLRPKHCLEKTRKVKPLPWRAAQLTVVGVEAVDIDDCAQTLFPQGSPHQKARASEEALRLEAEAARGVVRTM